MNMNVRAIGITVTASLVLLLSFTTMSFADVRGAINEFRRTFNNNKASTREKHQAVQALPNNDKQLVQEYITVLEQDVWQWRADILGKIQSSRSDDLLAGLEEFLDNQNQVIRNPAAAEHIVWGLLNNSEYQSAEKFAKLSALAKVQRIAPKVKYRVVRELGVWRGDGSQSLAKANVGVLIDLLEWILNERRADETLKFLIIDSLESLTTQEFEESVQQWRFWHNSLTEEDMLTPRTPERFKDDLGDIELEGHSFVRRNPRAVEAVDVLILPEFGYSEQYWYPYIFELNKLFNCVFVELPDASRVQGLERPTDRTGRADPNAYYYPLAQLVEAFEERRKASGHEKVGIIAHGVSGWIAKEYTRLYPDSVLFCVIMNSWNGEQSYRGSSDNLQGSRDPDFRWFGESLVYDPTNRRGPGSMDEDQLFHSRTGAFKRMHADHRALEPIFYSTQGFRKVIPGGRALVPRYEIGQQFRRNQSVDVPTLFIWGEHDLQRNQQDLRQLQGIYRRGMFEVFPNSSRTPWAEEPLLFNTKIRELLERNGVDLTKPDPEEEEEERPGRRGRGR
jgi:pimeloyl-ACP methyl ester carboxylesterase